MRRAHHNKQDLACPRRLFDELLQQNTAAALVGAESRSRVSRRQDIFVHGKPGVAPRRIDGSSSRKYMKTLGTVTRTADHASYGRETSRILPQTRRWLSTEISGLADKLGKQHQPAQLASWQGQPLGTLVGLTQKVLYALALPSLPLLPGRTSPEPRPRYHRPVAKPLRIWPPTISSVVNTALPIGALGK